jgi:hypothetical protein
MTPTLRIADDLALPLDAATETFAILGKRGSGKSNTAVVLFEEMHRAGIPCVAIDPKGDWYGLRSAADGKGPGLPVPVFGGRHGDVPLEPSAGGYLADLIVERSLTCVVDVSELSRADVIRFLTAFGVRLYRQAQDEPMHLFLEECHEYLPQRVGPAEAPLVGAWQRIVKQGRFKGIGCTLISQRSAAVNKDVLNQAEALIAMRVLAPHDRAAVKGWVEVHGDAAEILGTLHELNDGEGWVWAPDMLGAPRRVQFRRRATYDSGATPKVGQRRREPATLADVDLVAIKEAMAESIEKAKADDPKELRRRVAALERELREARTTQAAKPEPVTERVEVPVLDERARGHLDRLSTVLVPALENMPRLLAEATEALEAVLDGVAHVDDRQDIPGAGTASGGARPVAQRQPRPAQRTDPPAGRKPRRAAVPGAAPAEGSDGVVGRRINQKDHSGPDCQVKLGKRERAILSVLAQYPGRTHRQLALLTGYSAKASTIGAGLSTLRKAGYVEPNGDPIRITAAGLAHIEGHVEALPTGHALLEWWRTQLGRRERLILDALVEVYPDTLDHAELCDLTGYSPEASTVSAGLSKLRALELVDGWRASDDLMEAVRT